MAYLSNPAQVYDYSITLAGTVGTACAQNTSRSFLMMQYNGGTNTSSCAFSFTNPNPGFGLPGCYTLYGSAPPLTFGPVVPNGPIYVGTGTGTLAITQG